MPLIYTQCIRGNDNNDILVSGDFGLLAHFNGVDWQIYNDYYFQMGVFESLQIKGNLAVVSGYIGTEAVILVGKR